jgi:hypothetical protein
MRITITIEDTPGGTEVAFNDATGGLHALAATAPTGAIDAGPAPNLDGPAAMAAEPGAADAGQAPPAAGGRRRGAASTGRAPARPRTRRSR